MGKGKQASAISGGIFLISLGVLIITGWRWPGILIAIGLAGGAEQIFRGRVARGVGHPSQTADRRRDLFPADPAVVRAARPAF